MQRDAHQTHFAIESCVFCRIVNQELPAEVVYETDATLAFFPQTPATKGHTLVVPKRHIANFLECEGPTSAVLSLAVAAVGRALREVLKPEGMNVITSAGEVASQSVMHLHFHVVPRWAGDALGEIWPPKVSTSEHVLEDMADAVRRHCHTEELGRRNPDKN